MAKSAVSYEKPLPHIGLSDWYAKQWELQQSTDTRRVDSFELRNLGRRIHSETDVKTKWNTAQNNTRIEDRLTELTQWKNILERLLHKLQAESRSLAQDKSDAEEELESLSHPLRIIAECISMRDCRRGTELTYDEADTELKRELALIEKIKQTLTERCQAAWEKINSVEETMFKLRLNLEDKDEAMKIDRENLALDHTSSNISFKMNALKFPKNCVTYEAWRENCQALKAAAEAQINDVFKFRQDLTIMRERARNDIKSQQDMTNYSLRKRIYQTQKAQNELDWQKRKVQKEMTIMQEGIVELEDALLNKTNTIKCAETRLENRTYRLAFELCCDAVGEGLKDEVQQLRQTEEDLTQAVNSTKASYNGLESLLLRIDTNLDDKQHSLTTDSTCLDMRAVLNKRN